MAGAVPAGGAAPGRRHRPRRPAGAAPGGPDRRAGARFSGGDLRISAGVRAAWDDDPAGLSNTPAEQTTTWRELTRYLDLARHRTHTKEQERA